MFRRLVNARSVATVASVTVAAKIRTADCSPSWWWPFPVDYKALRADIDKLIDSEEERRNDGTSIAPVSSSCSSVCSHDLPPHTDVHPTGLALLWHVLRC